MQTTYRLKAQEISITLLKSLKNMFAGQEVEITIRSLKSEDWKHHSGPNQQLADMIKESRTTAPVISADINIRALIDESQYPDN